MKMMESLQENTITIAQSEKLSPSRGKVKSSGACSLTGTTTKVTLRDTGSSVPEPRRR